MKHITIIFIVLLSSFFGINSNGQVRGESYFATKWVFDFNIPLGIATQSPTTNFIAYYPNSLNTKFSQIKLTNGFTKGYDAQIGYFFGERHVLGIGGGVWYQIQNSNATLDTFHTEFQATDKNRETFRQLVSTAAPITEVLQISNINIPVMLKYKQRIKKKLGISVDAGVIINMQLQYGFNSTASFNYEAIYNYINTGKNEHKAVYDNSPTPSSNDWLITIRQYENHNKNINIQKTFDSLSAIGYNVALKMKPKGESDVVSFNTGSIGYFFRPAVNLYLSGRTYLSLGGYFSYQTIQNATPKNYQIIDKTGSFYSSISNTIYTNVNTTYGVSIGLRYFIGESTIYDEFVDPDRNRSLGGRAQ